MKANPKPSKTQEYINDLRNQNQRLRAVLAAINDFWTDCAENGGKGGARGACLSPSATIMDSDMTIAAAVAEALK